LNVYYLCKFPPFLRHRERQGKLLGIIPIGVLLVIVSVGLMYVLGASTQKNLDSALIKGHQAFSKNDAALAVKAFQKAESLFCTSLRFYRKLSGSASTKASEDEVRQLLVSACLMKAYSDFLKLHPSPEVLLIAAEASKQLRGDDTNALCKNVSTAQEVNLLVQQIDQKKFRAVMQGLLEAEKRALPTDRDFFLAEIRLLAACGNGLKSPEVLTQAREILWYLNYEIGVEGEQIDALWEIVSQ